MYFRNYFELNMNVRISILLEEVTICMSLQLIKQVAAVVERSRDALCPSVVSLNKIITRAESFIIVT